MRYRTVLCGDCGLVYLCPRPDEPSYVDFYSHLYPRLYGRGRVDESATIRGRAVIRFLAESGGLRGQRGLFDVGCGQAELLRAAACEPETAGLRLGGCDPGWPGPGDEVIRGCGVEIEILKRNIEEVGDRLANYSVFVLYDVLEHLLDPRGLLTMLHGTTKKGTLLFVSTSCLDYWHDIPRGGLETYYFRLAHTYTFSRGTLDALMSGTGWTPTRRRAAPKGDQWLLSVRENRRRNTMSPLPGHAEEVRGWIGSYRAAAGR